MTQGRVHVALPSVWCTAEPVSIPSEQIMMRQFTARLALMLCATSAVAFAQPTTNVSAASAANGNAQNEVPAAGEPSQVPRTITVEKREQGQVTSASVTRGNNTYHVKPVNPAGSALPGDAQSPQNRAAQWQIFQFDWQRQPGTETKPVPPAPPVESQK